MKRRPVPPREDLVRRPCGPFGWLDAHLLHEHWLARLGADATAVLTLLALAADRRGASFFGRARMAIALDMDVARVEAALGRLLELHLVAFRAWGPGQRDGVWQLLPLASQRSPRAGRMMSVAELLRGLGVAPDNSTSVD